MDGEAFSFSDLTEESQQHILKLVSEGYESGEVIEEFDDEEDENEEESDEENEDV